MLESKSNYRLQLWIAIASAVLMLAKFVAWYLTHSVAILTDALESIVNVVAGLIGLYSLYVAAKPRDQDHPYGHGKAEFVSAAVEGTMVLCAGVLIIYKAIHGLINPQSIHQLDAGIYVVAATAVINYVMGSIAIRQGKRNGSLALQASGRHLQSDTWSTAGIVAGLVLLMFTGWWWVDSAISIVLSVYIIYTGYHILRESLAGIMDEADEKLLQNMVQLLDVNRKANWVDVHNLRIIKYGMVLHLDCHLTVPWYLNVHEAHNEVDDLANLVRNEFGETMEMFIHSDGCLEFQCRICIKQDCPVRQHSFEERINWTLQNLVQNEKHGLDKSLE